MSRVHIVTSDKGWILEKLASEIEDRLPYVSHDIATDATAEIQYYITYSARRQRVSPIEVGYFSHIERDEKTAQRFFSTADEVDYCVCQADMYAKALREKGCTNVTVISPGVDLDKFALKIRIGVVGRTYHTGRKGEHLVAQLMDIPEIEWHFTGSGWPGPALNIPESRLPAFYRDMDYILVPSLYEGGPMCVVEALACGTPVISSAVGWTEDFPHIPFKNGDVKDLRRVITDLVKQRVALRASVLDRTWDSWAEKHDRLFRTLLDSNGLPVPSPPARSHASVASEANEVSASLVLHGNETKSLGGPTVRVPRTATELSKRDVPSRLLTTSELPTAESTLVHVFNAWNPDTALHALRTAKSTGKTLVFSPIYLDLSERPYWQDDLPKMFGDFLHSGQWNRDDLNSFEKKLENRSADLKSAKPRTAHASEVVPGYHSKVREMVRLSDHCIFLSEAEKAFVLALGATPSSSSIVRNPVDSDQFSNGDPSLFRAEYGADKFVLCVARIEPRKNQLMLVHALRGMNIPIVLIGHAPNAEYANLVRAFGGENLRIIERLAPNSPMLRSAYAAASVVVLPSWCEGAPLAALEAAAAGARLVLSDRSSEKEYFGDLATYCDPASPSSIRQAISEAYKTGEPGPSQRLQAHVANGFSWAKYISGTTEAYRQAYATSLAPVQGDDKRTTVRPTPLQHTIPNKNFRIVFDVTTSANHKGRWTGISRVEMAIAASLTKMDSVSVNFVAWNNQSKQFLHIPRDVVLRGGLAAYVNSYGGTQSRNRLDDHNSAAFVVCGSGWMQNSTYTAGLIAYVKAKGHSLVPIIHDIIPVKFPFWFNPGYTPTFESNLQQLLSASTGVVAISQATRSDVEDFYLRKEGLPVTVRTFREGDEIFHSDKSGLAESTSTLFANLNLPRDFVLAVGAIHLRKNHRLLYEVWLKLSERMREKTPHLVIVGGIAWNGGDVARALMEDPRLKGIVHILEDVSDDLLNKLYGECMLTTYPSLYEGWGLPVAESLKRGRICLASDAASIAEIAPHITDILDPTNVTEWVDRIAFYAQSPNARRERERAISEQYQSRSWEDATSELVSVLRGFKHTQHVRPYAIGESLDLSSALESARYKIGAWHIPEKWGSWTADSTAGLDLPLTELPHADLVLTAQCTALGNQREVIDCTVQVNGQIIGRWAVKVGTSRLYSAVIPQSVASSSNLRIEFKNSLVERVSTLKPGTADARAIGIGVSRVVVAEASASRNADVYWPKLSSSSEILKLGDEIDLVWDSKRASLLAPSTRRDPSWGMYSTGPLTSLSLPILGFSEDVLTLRVLLRPVVPDGREQRITALANGEYLDMWTFSEATTVWKQLVVPPEIVALESPVRIEFVGEHPCSPASVQLGNITDLFCVGLFALTLESAHTYAKTLFSEQVVTLTRNETQPISRDVLTKLDWHKPEVAGTWARGRVGTLQFEYDGIVEQTLYLQVEVRSVAHPGGASILLSADLNGIELWSSPIKGGWQTLTFKVPPRTLRDRGSNVLTLSSSFSIAPVRLGMSPDARDLSFMIRSIRIGTALADEVVTSVNSAAPLPKIESRLDETRAHVPKLPIPEEFAEESYLQSHPDVAAAVKAGIFESGFQHWSLYGYKEKRRFD